MDTLLETGILDTLGLIKVAMEQIQDWFIITDINGRILYHNNQVEKISGYSGDEIKGNNPSMWKSGEHTRQTYENLWDTILSGKPYHGVIANRCKEGKVFYLANTISPVKDKDDNIQYFVSTAKDITQNYELKNQLYAAIHHDALTGLLNRKYFIKEIENVIDKTKKSAMLVVSMENIGTINNTYGFVFGDQIVKKIGKRIKKIIDENHIFARIEESVFGIFIPDFNTFSTIILMIKTIEKVINKPFLLEGNGITELYVEVLTGVSIYPSDASEATELLLRAQTALSKVRSIDALKNYAFYTPQMKEEAKKQLLQEIEIYKAYENNEFIPYFQPFINLENEEICGAEALMRRKNSSGEIILPGEFIDTLEQMGLIEKVELRFLKEVCCQIREWIDQGIKVLPIAINLSALQFKDASLAEKIISIIDKESIPRDLITIEITESLCMEDMMVAKAILQKLTEAGFLISLDDFGTGYSSFSYLKKTNVSQLKIDRSFIEDIVCKKEDQEIVKAIVAMAEALGIQTVAEGIENKDQFQIVSQLGCDIGQGYYWDYALPAKEIVKKYPS